MSCRRKEKDVALKIRPEWTYSFSLPRQTRARRLRPQSSPAGSVSECHYLDGARRQKNRRRKEGETSCGAVVTQARVWWFKNVICQKLDDIKRIRRKGKKKFLSRLGVRVGQSPPRPSWHPSATHTSTALSKPRPSSSSFLSDVHVPVSISHLLSFRSFSLRHSPLNTLSLFKGRLGRDFVPSRTFKRLEGGTWPISHPKLAIHRELTSRDPPRHNKRWAWKEANRMSPIGGGCSTPSRRRADGIVMVMQLSRLFGEWMLIFYSDSSYYYQRRNGVYTQIETFGVL